MLAEGGNVPMCPRQVRVPQPTSQKGMMGRPHPSLPLKTLSEHWPVPSLPRRMCQSRRVSHPSTRLFAVLSKGCSFMSYCQQDFQPVGWFLPGGAPCGIVYPEVHATVGTLIILESELEEFAFKPSLACVLCPAGWGSHPFPILPLLSAVAWPSTASG